MNPRLRHALREARGKARHHVGRAAAALVGARADARPLDPAKISKVLLCRINARMGNAVFLTPLLQRLHERLPWAAIDIASAYPKADDLLGRLPGVRRVIRFPYKGVGLPWRYVAALGRVRRERYDLIIDPVPNSTSGRIVLILARARLRLGFAAADQWAPLTHAVSRPPALVHQAMLPAVLLSRAFGWDDDLEEIRLWLPLSREELEAGRAAVARAIEAQGGGGDVSRTVGFFAHATGLKTVAAAYWQAFWDAFLELEPAAIPVEILPTPTSTPTDARCAALHMASPRALTAAMAAMRLFVCADTGPLHLAGTTAVPTVGLFQASDPALYGPLKPTDLALDVRQCSPREAALRCQALWGRPAAGGARLDEAPRMAVLSEHACPPGGLR